MASEAASTFYRFGGAVAVEVDVAAEAQQGGMI